MNSSLMKITPFALVILFVLGTLGWAFVLTSCSGGGGKVITETPPTAPNIDTEKQDVGKVATEVGGISRDVGERADKIDIHTEAIESKTPPEAKEAVKPDISGIKEETRGLRTDSATLSAVEQKLKDTEQRLAKQQESIEKYTEYAKTSEIDRVKLQNEIKELKSSNSKMLKTMMSWIVVVSVIGIGASLVIGFFFKTPAAFMVAAGCVATLGIAVAVTLYLQQIAWVALALLGVGFVAAVIYVFTQMKDREKAVKELVHTGEVAKTYLPTTVRERIFGNAVEPGVAHQIQSSSTMKLVRNVREKEKGVRGFGLAPELPKFWRPTEGDLLPVTPISQDPYLTPVVSSNPAKTILG